MDSIFSPGRGIAKVFVLLIICLAVIASLTACHSPADNSKESEQPATESFVETISDPETEQTSSSPETEQTSRAEETTEADTESVTEDPDAKTYEPVVFMYHLILEEPYSPYTSLYVSPADFSDHMDALNEMGYRYIFADEYAKHTYRTAVLTFDDGYVDNYTEMFPILKEKGGRATIFLIADLIGTDGYLNEEQIQEMAQSGLVSFQSHTCSHPRLPELSAEAVRDEFQNSIQKIEGLTGRPVRAIAYPYGKTSDTVRQLAGEYFTFAYTTQSPAVSASDDSLMLPRYGIPRGYSKQQFMSILWSRYDI